MKTSDIRGAARLATDATAGLTDLVEAMHERIARLPGLGAVLDGRTKGITGLVYKTVRGVTRVAGGTVDALLGLLTPALNDDADHSPGREAVVAALNGVLGDHLVASRNPLAIPMAFRRDGITLPLDREALAAQLPDAGPTLLVLLHGLCMNDLQWQRQGHDHGVLLARELGCTPVYLHYNSGRAIDDNGREFAGLMQRLVDAWPVPAQQVLLLTHSMGGLVVRSAWRHAAEAGMNWPKLVDDLVFLGTPHLGAPLERAGHGLDLLLGATPYAAPLARLGRVRSAGITDLRHGDPTALPEGPRCWAIAATLGDQPGAVKGRLLGDGLVPLDSAFGRHNDAVRDLAFAPGQQCVVHDTNHMELLSSPVVAAQLLRWLKGADTRPAQAPA